MDGVQGSEDVVRSEGIELPEWQIYRSYLEGVDLVQKPKMLDKMSRNGVAFSWFTLLLGPLYYLYRKQYVAGWLYFLGINVLGILLSATGAFVTLPMAMHDVNVLSWWLPLSTVLLWSADIVMCFAFYPLYRCSAKRAYEDWKNEDGESSSAAIGYLERKGGVSWPWVIVMIGLNLVISVVTRGLLPFW